MVFIETATFEKDRAEHFTDEVFTQLEQALADDPQAVGLISHGKGLRKIRWALPGRGASDLLLASCRVTDIVCRDVCEE